MFAPGANVTRAQGKPNLTITEF